MGCTIGRIAESCSALGKVHSRALAPPPSLMKSSIACGLVAATAINLCSSPAWAKPPPIGDWRLTFSDDFERFDGNKWELVSRDSPRLRSVEVPQNVQVRDGKLRLRVRKVQGRRPWTTASVTSRFEQKFGYFEARYRYAPAPGLNNAFWLMSETVWQRGGTEIDINEGRWPLEVLT